MIVALMMVSIPSLFVLRKIMGVWFKRYLEADTMKRRRRIAQMRKELEKLRKIPKQKTLNEWIEKEEKPDYLSEETLESLGIPSSCVQDMEECSTGFSLVVALSSSLHCRDIQPSHIMRGC